MSDDFEIKVLDIQDLPEALALVWNVFLEFEAPDYTDEGIQEFKNFLEDDAIKKKITGGQFYMWTCSDNEKVVGVLMTRPPAHISLLFVDKHYHRKGIARSLFERMIESYGGKDIEITVNSSPYAKEVYHKLGFVDTDTEQTVNGIRFIPMKFTIFP